LPEHHFANDKESGYLNDGRTLFHKDGLKWGQKFSWYKVLWGHILIILGAWILTITALFLDDWLLK
ncbi:MAG: hypothetical protein AAFX87_22275, partial [Bacteroidota bacterium]